MKVNIDSDIERVLFESIKNVLTVEDVSRLTGMSTNTIYKYCNERKLPHYKSAGGKMTYFKRCEVEQWMCHTKIETEDEILKMSENRQKYPKNL